MKINIIGATIISIGIASAGFFINGGLKLMNSRPGSVSVKGVVEMPVEADRVSWTIKYTAFGKTLDEALSSYDKSNTLVKNLLEKKGFSGEYRPHLIESYNERGQGGNEQGRYKITGGYILSTNKIKLFEDTYIEVVNLAKEGVAFVESYDRPEYHFTKFLEKRPEIFSLAVKNAQEMAEKFAKDADVKLGPVTHANQGNFSILAATGGGSYEAKYSKKKVIRVVSHFTYSIIQ